MPFAEETGENILRSTGDILRELWRGRRNRYFARDGRVEGKTQTLADWSDAEGNPIDPDKPPASGFVSILFNGEQPGTQRGRVAGGREGGAVPAPLLA